MMCKKTLLYFTVESIMQCCTKDRLQNVANILNKTLMDKCIFSQKILV